MEKLRKIQAELKAPKNQRNNFGKYNYRSCEDILEALKPLLSKYECTLTISDEIKEIGSGDFKYNHIEIGKDKYGKPEFVKQVLEERIFYVESTAFISDGEESVHTIAQAGIDPNRKGMDIAQSFGSSSSYSRKYCLNGLFLIDDTKDADATNTHGKGSTTTEKTWLNKGTPEFKKAQTYLKGGGQLSKVEDKYRISKEVKELLTK
jgi:hypothetical protein